MKAILTVIFILTFSIKVSACECQEYNLKELDQKSYSWSDVIVIGDITIIGTKYEIAVSEVLRGKAQIGTLQGTTVLAAKQIESCILYPAQEGKYLIYLRETVIDGSTYYYSSECLGTRLKPNLLSCIAKIR